MQQSLSSSYFLDLALGKCRLLSWNESTTLTADSVAITNRSDTTLNCWVDMNNYGRRRAVDAGVATYGNTSPLLLQQSTLTSWLLVLLKKRTPYKQLSRVKMNSFIALRSVSLLSP